jgi:alpha-N-arabinofuranosidase
MMKTSSASNETSGLKRREFLRHAAWGVPAALMASYLRATPAADCRIDVLPGEPLGTIAPDIYGHFVEHLGGVVYDGIWVGEGSRVPNVNGIRKDLVDAMRRIQSPVIRWPGGCFADSYDWMDGIGPREKRPRRTNFWLDEPTIRDQGNIPQRFDPNQFGTIEFLRFCKLCGASPYLAVNLRSLPATRFYQWVEFCNSPAGSTTLAEKRAAAGFPEPFGVRYWGVGNESWGCGGNLTPEEYATEYRKFTAWVPRYGVNLSLIASGPAADDWNWTRRFFQKLVEKGPGQLRNVQGLSLHYYCENLARGATNDWNKRKGDAVQFEPVDWYELLGQGDRMEWLIEGHWRVMEEFDRAHGVKLIVDEWGPWYRPGTEVAPPHVLGQMITLRDAVVSAMTLDTFNRHPEKVAMGNCAQLVNCLNSLFLAHEDKFLLTPVYHVFDMYAPHQGAKAVRALFSAPSLTYERDAKPATFWRLKGSASLRDNVLNLTVVNPGLTLPCETEIRLRDASVRSVRVTSLTHADMHAHNTFDNPGILRPETRELDVRGSAFNYTFPPASVTRLQCTLG